MQIGVLALQGAFIEHENVLKKLGIDYFEIRKKDDLSKKLDGLIIPGGESTVMGKLLKDLDLFDEIKLKIENGLPVFGTCAGMILLAKRIQGEEVNHLGTMNIEVKRNAYGRQLGSFYVENNFDIYSDVKMPFIRAPYIVEVGENVKVLSCVDDKIVAARENNQLVTSFHPELTDEVKVHRYFLKMVEDFMKNN